ncbi:MAG: sensor histidine kinase [Chloroflexota bacterium]
MKRIASLFLPLAGVAAFELLALGWASLASGETARGQVTVFSAIVAALIFFTGLIPAILRPQPEHTLIATFAVLFAFFLLIPFEASDMPELRDGQPTYTFMAPFAFLRLVNGVILLPMALHISLRFPRRAPVPSRTLIGAYALSLCLLAFFLMVPVGWVRLLSVILLFGWFTFVMWQFLRNMLRIVRDPAPENARLAQQARVVMFSILIAETPLWIRPLTLALEVDLIPYNVLLSFQIFVPLGLVYAVLRHDLFGIDRFLRRTLAYGSVSLALLTLYLGLTFALTELFVNASRPLAPVVSVLAAALLFEPLRRSMQNWLDQLLYPDRLKFQAAVQSMQASLARANRRDEIARLLTEVFPAQIGAEWAALKLFPEPDVPPAHLVPAWNVRLVAGSINFGGYWLGPRRAGPGYDTDESNRLYALSGQAALALAYANAYESLYELNQNLEARVKEQTAQTLADRQSIAAYEERQRIARDLHDSVTQSLFGLHLMARGLKAAAPDSFKDQLAELESLASDILREMRLLLDQLRNAPSEEMIDLTEAIQIQVQAFAQKTGPEGGPLLVVEAELPAGLALPSSLAGAALWVIREALQNIARHSGCRAARLLVECDGRLRVSIRDEGAGFDVNAMPVGHYGLRGMRERVLALGGDFKVESRIGRGTWLSFNLPLPK